MVFYGNGVSEGIAIAPIRLYRRAALPSDKKPVRDVEKEVRRYESACGKAVSRLGEMAAQLSEKLGEENSLLFEIHQMMLEDSDFNEAVVNLITTEKVCAEYAVAETAKHFAALFSQMEDAYMQARAADVEDASRHVLEQLAGKTDSFLPYSGQPVILLADDFVPSETARFDRASVLGLVTTGGSANSHTAIFARTMGMPAVIGVGALPADFEEGTVCILDGGTGVLHLSPSKATQATYREKQNQAAAARQDLQRYRGQPTRTQGGQTIKLFANVGSVNDVDCALDNDAEGIGLFRSEFLFLEQNDYPREETQYAAYRAAIEKMNGMPVIIRTLDIGADKQAAYFKLPLEGNPALGMRAIRICLTQPEVFKTQLRAIYRASVYGNASIMLPMITSVSDVIQAKKIIHQVKNELKAEAVSFNSDLPVGLMIETPAAAIISDLLAKEADFFSIGTNDLTQYTLAVDRQNKTVEMFCDTHHEAVLRLISSTVKNAHERGIWVGICGELARDLSLTQTFLDIGVDELSVAPNMILQLRKRISES